MDFSALLAALNQASGFELYRLRVAIDRQRGNGAQSPNDANARPYAAVIFTIDGVKQLRFRQRALLGLAELEPIAVVAEPRFAIAPQAHEKLLAARKLTIVNAKQERRIGGGGSRELAVCE